MIWMALTMSTACAVLLTWQVQVWMGPALRRYREVYTQDARIKLGEVFLFINPTQLLIAAVLLAVLTGGVILLLTNSVTLAGISAVFAARLPLYLMRRLRRRRLDRLERQLPAALLVLACALRSGAGMSTALRHVTDHSEAPLSQEFGLLLREQRMGVAFDLALDHLRDRVPSEATSLLVAALRIAFHTGGNLAETLEGMARTLRERLQLRGKVQSLTAQGRLQAWVVGALPLLLLGALTYIEPDTMAMLWHTSIGWGVLAVLLGLETTGMLLIRRIVNIDI